MSQQVQESAERITLELAGRRAHITFMALVGVWVGITIVLTGAPNFIENWFSPWSRYVVGGAAGLGGFLTIFAGALGDRNKIGFWGQVVGLTLMVLWFSSMALGYGAVVGAVGIDIVAPGEELAKEGRLPSAPLASAGGFSYVPVLYFGLACMAAVPLITLLRLKAKGAAACPPDSGG